MGCLFVSHVATAKLQNNPFKYLIIWELDTIKTGFYTVIGVFKAPNVRRKKWPMSVKAVVEDSPVLWEPPPTDVLSMQAKK